MTRTMTTSTLADIAAAAVIALAMTAPDAMAAPVYEQAPIGDRAFALHAAVPEPASFALVAVAMAAAGGTLRRRANNA
jgi:hypothetical protein